MCFFPTDCWWQDDNRNEKQTTAQHHKNFDFRESTDITEYCKDKNKKKGHLYIISVFWSH